MYGRSRFRTRWRRSRGIHTHTHTHTHTISNHCLEPPVLSDLQAGCVQCRPSAREGWWTRALIHSFDHSFFLPFILSSIHLTIHSFFHSFVLSFIHSVACFCHILLFIIHLFVLCFVLTCIHTFYSALVTLVCVCVCVCVCVEAAGCNTCRASATRRGRCTHGVLGPWRTGPNGSTGVCKRLRRFRSASRAYVDRHRFLTSFLARCFGNRSAKQLLVLLTTRGLLCLGLCPPRK